MKELGKRIVIVLAWRLVAKLRKKHRLKIIAVSGSIGKTSTKRAIATVLSQAPAKVQWQDGNYNDIVSVPLVFFGQTMPSLTNPLAWLKTLLHMNWQIKNYPYKIVVLELGTDGPGQIAQFGKYLQVDTVVVTPIAPEHMEFFDNIEAVAREELSVQSYSKTLILHQSIAKTFSDQFSGAYKTYGQNYPADAHLVMCSEKIAIIKTKQNEYKFPTQLIGHHQNMNLAAACLVAEDFGLDKQQVEKGLANISAVPGRMQRLKGIKSSTIIDDTYNASPEAVKAALDTLKSLPGIQKIAVLGNMNELGGLSPMMHEEIGKYCDPNVIDLLITIGSDANQYLASAAAENGCSVIKSESPYTIGGTLKNTLEPDSLILLKGSQNGVFLEEAIKPILADPKDSSKLVRQTKDWISKKQKAFS